MPLRSSLKPHQRTSDGDGTRASGARAPGEEEVRRAQKALNWQHAAQLDHSRLQHEQKVQEAAACATQAASIEAEIRQQEAVEEARANTEVSGRVGWMSALTASPGKLTTRTITSINA